jgi:tRNA G18 (ribose-2'-O)-methylase SpoU
MMARVERVDDPDDPRLRDFVQLRDVQLRSKREPAEGLFLAEGHATIRRALAAGYALRSAVGSEKHLAGLDDVLGPLDASVYRMEPNALTSTTGFPVHRGALASFARKPLPTPEALIAEANHLLVLEDINDHTNLGAVFRSAAALGWRPVLLTPRCADPFYRRAIRTSMGAVFSVPWTRMDWAEGSGAIRAAGFSLVALTPSADAVAIDELERPRRVALVLGSEGAGISTRWLGAADVRMRIPMHAGVDSLNVAAAAAIALYVLGPRH